MKRMHPSGRRALAQALVLVMIVGVGAACGTSARVTPRLGASSASASPSVLSFPIASASAFFW